MLNLFVDVVQSN